MWHVFFSLCVSVGDDTLYTNSSVEGAVYSCKFSRNIYICIYTSRRATSGLSIYVCFSFPVGRREHFSTAPRFPRAVQYLSSSWLYRSFKCLLGRNGRVSETLAFTTGMEPVVVAPGNTTRGQISMFWRSQVISYNKVTTQNKKKIKVEILSIYRRLLILQQTSGFNEGAQSVK